MIVLSLIHRPRLKKVKQLGYLMRKVLTSKPNFSCSVPILQTQNVKLASWYNGPTHKAICMSLKTKKQGSTRTHTKTFNKTVPPFLLWFATRGKISNEILSRKRLSRNHRFLYWSTQDGSLNQLIKRPSILSFQTDRHVNLSRCCERNKFP